MIISGLAAGHVYNLNIAYKYDLPLSPATSRAGFTLYWSGINHSLYPPKVETGTYISPPVKRGP